jgi:hypothetical protein
LRRVLGAKSAKGHDGSRPDKPPVGGLSRAVLPSYPQHIDSLEKYRNCMRWQRIAARIHSQQKAATED